VLAGGAVAARQARIQTEIEPVIVAR